MRIRSANDVFEEVKANRFRDYPAKAKSQVRLVPFAQPNIREHSGVTDFPKCFLLGGCLSRMFESALTTAGFEVLSGRQSVGLQHESLDGPLVFNKPILGSAENELRWALEHGHDGGVASLIEFDGEWTDLQISPQFAHEYETAQRLRREINASHAAVRDADLVMINLSRASCWFDTQTGLYINDFSPERIEQRYPGRFVMHDFSVEDMKAAIHRVCDLIWRHSNRYTPARIVLCVSPIGMRSGRTAEDQMIADMESKAICRVAAAEFARENEHVDYGPIYEFAMLSDRSKVFSSAILDHLEEDCVERFLGEYLGKVGADPATASYLATRGKAGGYYKAGMPEQIIAIIEKHFDKYGYDPRLGLDYASALQRDRRVSEAFDAYLRHARSGADNAQLSLKTAFNLAAGKANIGMMEHCSNLAVNADDPTVQEMAQTWRDHIDRTKKMIAERAAMSQRVDELTAKLMEDPAGLVRELQNVAQDPATPSKIKWLYAQALLRSRDDAATPFLKTMLDESSPFSRQAGNKLLTILRKAGGSIGDIYENDVQRAIVALHNKNNGGR